MVSGILKKFAVVSTLVFSQFAQASPISLAANSNYLLNGTGLGVGEQFANTGGLFLAFYQTNHGAQLHAGDFYAYFDLSGTMDTGNISGNNLASLNTSSAGSLINVVRYNGTAWQNVSVASGTLASEVNYQNVSLNNNKDIFATVNGTGTGNASLDLSISHSGGNLNLTNFLAGISFMPFDTATQGFYDPAINAFSNNGILDFAMAGFNGGLHGWFASGNTVQFGGQTFYLQGDIHANYSEIPEPASMGLLVAGLLGGSLKRRKAKHSA